MHSDSDSCRSCSRCEIFEVKDIEFKTLTQYNKLTGWGDHRSRSQTQLYDRKFGNLYVVGDQLHTTRCVCDPAPVTNLKWAYMASDSITYNSFNDPVAIKLISSDSEIFDIRVSGETLQQMTMRFIVWIWSLGPIVLFGSRACILELLLFLQWSGINRGNANYSDLWFNKLIPNVIMKKTHTAQIADLPSKIQKYIAKA